MFIVTYVNNETGRLEVINVSKESLAIVLESMLKLGIVIQSVE